MLTNASKYAIRAVLYLTKHANTQKKLSSSDIAKGLDLSESFIAKLLQTLAKKKIISSLKGPKGGFFMSKDNLKNNINDVIWAIEERNIFDGCFLGLPRCSDENPCPIHHIVAPFKDELFKKFNDITILEFSDEIQINGTFLTIKDSNKSIEL